MIKSKNVRRLHFITIIKKWQLGYFGISETSSDTLKVGKFRKNRQNIVVLVELFRQFRIFRDFPKSDFGFLDFGKA